MKYKGFGIFALGVFGVAGCSAGLSGDGDVGTAQSEIVGPSTLGGRNEVVMLYAQVAFPTGGFGTRFCSGTYFAPRVVVTAAHCLENIFQNQLFVYHGDDFATDFAKLSGDANGLVIPAPGQASLWSHADSFESHPNYVPSQHFPDIGVVYLDRKLPFDPLPLLRTPLATNRTVTISGWGANTAPTPTTGAGGRVQRTGTTVTLGSPTAADFHPEDPNPGVLVAANQLAQMKLDGRAPNANTCFGDSGGPILVTDGGQTYIAGVNYFTGLSCADYSLSMRINSFLPFLDQAYKKGGQDSLKPTFDCVAPNAAGTLTAFFGYDNKNGVGVTVPYGTKNTFALDTTGQRVTRFLPGQHHFSFGVDFAANQTLSWKLTPDNNPSTTITVNSSSRRCAAAEADQTECALSCRTSQHAACAQLPTFEGCVKFCTDQIGFIRSDVPVCLPQNKAINVCTAGLSFSPANFECNDPFGGVALTPCAAQFTALDECFQTAF